MRVLVLGANGFIGRRVREILGERHAVVPADIDFSPDPGFLHIDPEHPDFLWLVERAGADAIVNCSGAASVPASFEAPYRDYTLNTLRIAQLLEAIRVSRRATRLVHLSSAAVYGNPTSFPIRESEVGIPLSPYGWHKRQAELICEEYSRTHGIETISLRIFSAYGPGLRKQIFWDVFQKSLRSGTVELFGTGEETRDFIYIDDLALAIERVLEHATFDGRTVNTASGIAVPIRQAVTVLLDHLGSGCTPRFSGTARRGDPTHWEADIGYLRSLGFQPRFDINSGLQRTARWLAEQQ